MDCHETCRDVVDCAIHRICYNCYQIHFFDTQALFESASRGRLIDDIENISKCQLGTPSHPDLIRVMQRHPSPLIHSTNVPYDKSCSSA